MSHMKIAGKILEVMREIPTEQEIGKLNEVLISQKLVTKTEYEIVGSSRATDKNGVIWHFVNVSCHLTIVDVESDEILVNVVFGSGIDSGDKAVTKAQLMARKHAWLAALNITPDAEPVGAQDVTPEPQIIVETPESKLIEQIQALWKWDTKDFPDWILKRGKKPIEQLNIPELTAIKQELEGYRKEHG